MADSRLQHVRHVALDMDGTIYKGSTVFDETKPFLDRLASLDIGHTFLTNNSSKSVAEYLAQLAAMGIPATADQLYTSTQATIEFLCERMASAKRLFLLGTPSMRREFLEAGFESTEDSADDEPDAVVAGFDTTLTFPRLCRAAYWIQRGKPFIATHPDRVCPTDAPTVLVDCGSVCAALEKATGRAPSIVLGKPDPSMIAGILRRHCIEPHQLAMVGDRLYTDMAMARRAGAVGVLVLTGETTPAEAAANPPYVVVANLTELGERLAERKSSSTEEPP